MLAQVRALVRHVCCGENSTLFFAVVLFIATSFLNPLKYCWNASFYRIKLDLSSVSPTKSYLREFLDTFGQSSWRIIGHFHSKVSQSRKKVFKYRSFNHFCSFFVTLRHYFYCKYTFGWKTGGLSYCEKNCSNTVIDIRSYYIRYLNGLHRTDLLKYDDIDNIWCNLTNSDENFHIRDSQSESEWEFFGQI